MAQEVCERENILKEDLLCVYTDEVLINML